MHSDKVSTSVSESRNRKSTKPIMEKRRRARINASLAELKSLLLEVIKREGARHSKMEKADILEMTVKHLRDMQRQSFTDEAANNPAIINKHRLGFSECTQEVSRYLSNVDGCDVELRTRLLDHLANFVTGTEPSSPPPMTSHPVSTLSPSNPLPVQSAPQTSPPYNQPPNEPHSLQPHQFTTVTDINNNHTSISKPQPVQQTKVVSGLQVIPTKLQTGEIAFVLPGNVQGSNTVPNYIIPVYTPPNVASVKPAVTLTTGVTTPSSYMTILPSSEVFQTCTLSPGNVNIIPQPVSSPISMSSSMSKSSPASTSSPVSTSSPCSASPACFVSLSPSSASDSSVMSTSPQLRPYGRDLLELRHHDVMDLGEIRHQPVDNTVWRPW